MIIVHSHKKILYMFYISWICYVINAIVSSHIGQNMPILDVPRNRDFESIGQEIRVRHDFIPHFCLLPFVYIWFTFPGHKKCVYVQK